MKSSELLPSIPKFWYFFFKIQGFATKKMKYVSLSLHMYKVGVSPRWGAAVAQWVRSFVPQGEGRVFESQPRQVVTAPLPNAQKKVLVSRVLGDDHYNVSQ